MGVKQEKKGNRTHVQEQRTTETTPTTNATTSLVCDSGGERKQQHEEEMVSKARDSNEINLSFDTAAEYTHRGN